MKIARDLYSVEELEDPETQNELVLSRYINSADDLYRYAEKIKPIEGYQDQIIHGDMYGFEIRDLNDNTVSVFTPKEFADILREDPSYNGGDIRLVACRAGANGGRAAQELADCLGVNVLAPSDLVYVSFDGEVKVGKDGSGKWILFIGRK